MPGNSIYIECAQVRKIFDDRGDTSLDLVPPPLAVARLGAKFHIATRKTNVCLRARITSDHCDQRLEDIACN